MKRFTVNTIELDAMAIEGTPLGDKLANILRSLFSDEANAKRAAQVDEYIDFELCLRAGQHLTDCDDDGYCIYCGHQESGPEDDHNRH